MGLERNETGGQTGEKNRTDRGQTANDYLLGVVLVLLTITAVFAFFPTLFQPFQEPVSSDQETMSENLADEVLMTNTTTTSEQSVNADEFDTHLSGVDTDAYGAQAGLQPWMRWNVTIQKSAGEEIESYGDSLDTHDGPTANAVRFIRLDGHDDCESGCQLVVRVW